MASRADLLFVGLAVAHAAAILAMPSAPLIALGVWWNSNTIAHNFIHRPFFRSPRLNLIFSACQSVLVGVPQALWRDRHLAHHAQVVPRLRYSPQRAAEAALVCGLWLVLAADATGFFLTTYLPGYLAGLALCGLQGHYEHAGGTTSHYGVVYNALCFNDGHHVEHHARPGAHWTTLPDQVVAAARASRWPAVLRWLDDTALRNGTLAALERLVFCCPGLRHFVLSTHRRALLALLQEIPPVRRVAIVGGGLFPRTALILRDLVPSAELVVIDARPDHLDTARHWLDGGGVRFEHARFSPADSSRGVDLLVIPLAFEGDRAAIYRQPPAPAVLVHDWAWRRRGRGRIVSLVLLKRINLVRAA